MHAFDVNINMYSYQTVLFTLAVGNKVLFEFICASISKSIKLTLKTVDNVTVAEKGHSKEYVSKPSISKIDISKIDVSKAIFPKIMISKLALIAIDL